MKKFIFFLICLMTINTSEAKQESNGIKYYIQASAGLSHTRKIPNFNMQGGLNTSKAPLRWGYRLGFGAISKTIEKVQYGLELGLTQYTKNKWSFSPLTSTVEQNLKGIEVLAIIKRHLTPEIKLALEGGAVLVIQNLTATAVFNNPARFNFQYLGREKQIKPILGVDLSNQLNNQSDVFINFHYIFGTNQDNVTVAGGPAPSPVPNNSWRKIPGIYNLMTGIRCFLN
jgi:hypothetical protein